MGGGIDWRPATGGGGDIPGGEEELEEGGEEESRGEEEGASEGPTEGGGGFFLGGGERGGLLLGGEGTKGGNTRVRGGMAYCIKGGVGGEGGAGGGMSTPVMFLGRSPSVPLMITFCPASQCPNIIHPK